MSIEPGILRAMPAESTRARAESTSARVEERLARRGGWIELLRGPALAYRAVTALRNALYEGGLLPSRRVDVPIVSVGNLTAGGTGKTPMVIWLARQLLARGRRPGVLARGYGAPAGSGMSDEAEMLVRALPQVPFVADPDRVRGARELARRGLDVVLLDDGFQHRRLARDLDLVLVDATRPWGLEPPPDGGRPVRDLLPRGLLRESARGLRRAHAIVLTRTDQADPEDLGALRAELHRIAPGPALVETIHRCVAVRDGSGLWITPDLLAGRTVDLVSGIGHPEAFERTVRAAGATIREHRRFPDHHPFSAADLTGLGGPGLGGPGERGPGERGPGERGEEFPIVTTSKDAVKIERLGIEPWVVEVEIAVAAGAAVLDALLDALPEARAALERSAIHEGLHG